MKSLVFLLLLWVSFSSARRLDIPKRISRNAEDNLDEKLRGYRNFRSPMMSQFDSRIVRFNSFPDVHRPLDQRRQDPILRHYHPIFVGAVFGILSVRALSRLEFILSPFSTVKNKYILILFYGMFLFNGIQSILSLFFNHSAKMVMKSGLAMNIIVEFLEALINIFSFLYYRSSHPLASEYLGKFVSNMGWGMFCLTISRGQWIASPDQSNEASWDQTSF